jgi:hypothetical protein
MGEIVLSLPHDMAGWASFGDNLNDDLLNDDLLNDDLLNDDLLNDDLLNDDLLNDDLLNDDLPVAFSDRIDSLTPGIARIQENVPWHFFNELVKGIFPMGRDRRINASEGPSAHHSGKK